MEEENRKILSVVIPSYNAELYITDALNSLLNCKNRKVLDIIVVNDGSKDDTERIAQQFSERFAEIITVITKENAGHGSGINIGISKARGKYLTVLDADDWYESVALDKVIEYAKYSSEDVLAANVIKYYEHNGDRELQRFLNVDYGKTYCMAELVKMDIPLVLPNIFYKTMLLKSMSIHIREKVSYDDEEYCMMPFAYVKSIKFVDADCYVYRQGSLNQSMLVETQLRKINDKYMVLEDMINYLCKVQVENDNYEYMCRRVDAFANSIYFLLLIYSKDRKNGYKDAVVFRKWVKEKSSIFAKRTKKIWIITVFMHLLGIDSGKWKKIREIRLKCKK